MSRRQSVEIIGHVCIDHNVTEHGDRYEGPGSPAMFMANIFRQLPDCSVAVVAPYGPDFLRYTSDIQIYPPEPSAPHTLIYENTTTATGRTQRAFNREHATAIPIDDYIAHALSQANMIFITPLLPTFQADYLTTIRRHARLGTPKILLPQGFFRQFDADSKVMFREFTEAEAILDTVDVVIMSDQDHPHAIELAKTWTADRGLFAIVTLGERGAVINCSPSSSASISCGSRK